MFIAFWQLFALFLVRPLSDKFSWIHLADGKQKKKPCLFSISASPLRWMFDVPCKWWRQRNDDGDNCWNEDEDFVGFVPLTSIFIVRWFSYFVNFSSFKLDVHVSCGDVREFMPIPQHLYWVSWMWALRIVNWESIEWNEPSIPHNFWIFRKIPEKNIRFSFFSHSFLANGFLWRFSIILFNLKFNKIWISSILLL